MVLGILVLFDVYVSDRVKIKVIEIRGLRLLKKDDVVDALKSLHKKWIFMLQLCNVEQRLKSRYGFLHVDVRAVWPDRVIVDVKEPRPVYILVKGGKKWIVVSNFYIYPYRKGIGLERLPLLYFGGLKDVNSRRLPIRLMKVIDEYVNGLRCIGFKVRKVEVVGVTKVVYYTKRGLRFVSDTTKRNIWKLRYVVAIMKKRSKKPASVIDLRFGNSIVVR